MKRKFTAVIAAVAALAASAQVPVAEPISATAAATTAVALPGSVTTIVDNINDSGNITVEQPAALAALVQPAQGVVADSESGTTAPAAAAATRSGYRVQVFDDNNPRTARAQSEQRRRQLLEAFPQWPCYVSFNSPYWQVRVGDFTTRGQAEAALAEIRDAFPSTAAYIRIVRDKINIE